jgi:hypothetical protein
VFRRQTIQARIVSKINTHETFFSRTRRRAPYHSIKKKKWARAFATDTSNVSETNNPDHGQFNLDNKTTFSQNNKIDQRTACEVTKINQRELQRDGERGILERFGREVPPGRWIRLWRRRRRGRWDEGAETEGWGIALRFLICGAFWTDPWEA